MDVLSRDVHALATPEGRMVGTDGHDAARKYLVGRMGHVGLEPYSGTSFELPYDAGRFGTMTNLVGMVVGAAPELPPLLVGAHYDTCGPLPGADDNAAAVAALLAAVGPVTRLGLRRSVIFAFFDGEEPPHFLTDTMGSIRFYEDQRTGPIAAAVILDLVGHSVPVPGIDDLLFALGAEGSKDVARVVRDAPVPNGIRVLPTLHRYAPNLSDHFAFIEGGRPFLFLSCGHGPDYHQATDTPDKVAYGKLVAISGYVVALLAGLDREPLVTAEPGDTTALEVECWARCWTVEVPGLPPVPRSRAEIERVVGVLTSGFGL